MSNIALAFNTAATVMLIVASPQWLAAGYLIVMASWTMYGASCAFECTKGGKK